MKTLLTSALLLLAPLAWAGPPGAPGKGAAASPGFGAWDDDREERREEREKRMRVMMVVGMAEALNLSEAEALRLADKMKGFDDKRKPLREQMFDSMKVLKAAADGDAVALGKVDGATLALLDLRQQMAAVDKEMFLAVSKDLSAQRRAQLALFLAKFSHERRGGGRGGRFHRPF